jgi:hypothetical protein
VEIRAVKTDEAASLVDSIVNSDKENAFAFQWKARQRVREADSPDSEALDKAREYLELAIRYSPEPAGVYRELAHVLSCQGDLDSALGALKESRKLASGNLSTLFDLAHLNIRRGADYFALAADLVEEAPEDLGEEKYLLLAYLHAFLGNDDKAEDAFGRYEERADDWQEKQLCFAHLRVAQQRIGEGTLTAEQALINSDDPPSRMDQLNWGELFICAAAFDRATEVLEALLRQGSDKSGTGAALIKLAEYLAQSGSRPSEKALLNAWERFRGWDFRELLLFRERMRAAGNVELGKRLEVLEDVIRQQQLASPSHRVLGSAYVGPW